MFSFLIAPASAAHNKSRLSLTEGKQIYTASPLISKEGISSLQAMLKGSRNMREWSLQSFKGRAVREKVKENSKVLIYNV